MNEQDINKFLKELEDAYKTVMRKINLASSDLVKQTKFEYKNGDIIVRMFDYADYIDSGRKRGAKGVPIKDLIQWIQEKNISSSIPVEQLAFAIQRSIQRKGIRPRPFLEKVHEEVHNLTALFVQRELEKEIIKRLNKTKVTQ